MRQSSLNMANGTNGNPQSSITQLTTEVETKKIEQQLEKETSNKRDILLESVKTEKAKKIINELYRPAAKVGDGGTADILIKEAINKVPKEASHYKKANDRLREIEKSIKKGTIKDDEVIMQEEANKLRRAINFWEERNGR